MITKEIKEQIIKDYQLKEGDTGSPEVQIAILTYRINDLNEHLKVHKKDHPFQKRPSQDGRPEKEPSCVSQGERPREIQDPYRSFRTEKIGEKALFSPFARAQGAQGGAATSDGA